MKTRFIWIIVVVLVVFIIALTSFELTLPGELETSSEVAVFETSTSFNATATTGVETVVPSVVSISTPTPFYDLMHPLRISDAQGNIIAFDSDVPVDISFNGEVTSSLGVKIFDPNDPKFSEIHFGNCTGRNLVVANGRDGGEYVTYKTIVYADSGTCKKGSVILPFEHLRKYFEGSFLLPSKDQREEMLQEVVGEQVCFDEACFYVTEAVYLTEEQLKEIGYIDGEIQHYFPSGEKPNTQEIFLVFCGSEGSSPAAWFSAKYFIRLQKAP